jgi:hypothetical protein
LLDRLLLVDLRLSRVKPDGEGVRQSPRDYERSYYDGYYHEHNEDNVDCDLGRKQLK